METFDEDDIRYQRAKRQVERLRGFYVHLFIYILVNLMIVYYNYSHLKPGESYFQFKNFFTATFWGIGIVAHAAVVFLSRSDYLRNWEEKKIRELMEKEKNYKRNS
ncbi:2TM domain-containing protein [Chryseobacterium arthrosphaerae]|uniref:2TM domain-containing protein n=1 Tax=Chryseobacterium arthrosphaerae TaxID=651561 RepID=A0ABU7QWW1_9FLAO|nr:2TM domain-containing protein [Chryseobacterium arthrosphaerae]UEQ75137.1 2TM domain-containing protein [Chryseobacterium arthrosphaerae]